MYGNERGGLSGLGDRYSDLLARVEANVSADPNGAPYAGLTADDINYLGMMDARAHQEAFGPTPEDVAVLTAAIDYAEQQIAILRARGAPGDAKYIAQLEAAIRNREAVLKVGPGGPTFADVPDVPVFHDTPTTDASSGAPDGWHQGTLEGRAGWWGSDGLFYRSDLYGAQPWSNAAAAGHGAPLTSVAAAPTATGPIASTVLPSGPILYVDPMAVKPVLVQPSEATGFSLPSFSPLTWAALAAGGWFLLRRRRA